MIALSLLASSRKFTQEPFSIYMVEPEEEDFSFLLALEEALEEDPEEVLEEDEEEVADEDFRPASPFFSSSGLSLL